MNILFILYLGTITEQTLLLNHIHYLNQLFNKNNSSKHICKL